MGKWRRDNFIEATFFWVSRFFSDMGRSKNFTKCSERKSKDSKQAVQYGIFKSGKCLQRGKKDKKKLFPLTNSSIIQPTEPTDGIVLWSSGKMWYAYTKQIFFFKKKGKKILFAPSVSLRTKVLVTNVSSTNLLEKCHQKLNGANCLEFSGDRHTFKSSAHLCGNTQRNNQEIKWRRWGSRSNTNWPPAVNKSDLSALRSFRKK